MRKNDFQTSSRNCFTTTMVPQVSTVGANVLLASMNASKRLYRSMSFHDLNSYKNKKSYGETDKKYEGGRSSFDGTIHSTEKNSSFQKIFLKKDNENVNTLSEATTLREFAKQSKVVTKEDLIAFNMKHSLYKK